MNIRSIIGNSLIIGSLLLVCYIYYPVAALFTPLSAEQIPGAFSIQIPEINAHAPIIANVDPWDKAAYEQPLKEGVAQAKGFADFGEKGTIFLFAHSALPPWEMTRANTAFLRLNELKINDEIIITKFDRTYKYKVSQKKEVWPDDVKGVLIETADQIILQTCTPMGTDIKRLLVFAQPVEE